MSKANQAVAQVAETYYDSDDADRFYFEIWGGEDIHIGLYEDKMPVREASHRTVRKMAEQLGQLGREARVLDVGAGYGGAARYLAKTFGCHVTCLNISEIQNDRNRKLTEEQGLADKIDVVYGNFEDLPFDDKSFDVVWSQDAILHSGNRPLVLREVARVLKSGGQFVFTDPMQAEDCPAGVLGPVLDRIHLDTLGSFGFYRSQLGELGFDEAGIHDLTPQLGRHYTRVREQLSARREELTGTVSSQYVDRMLQGLSAWINAESKGHLAWGILHFRKK